MRATYLFIFFILFMREAIFTHTVASLSKGLPHSHFFYLKREVLRPPPAPIAASGPREIPPSPPPPPPHVPKVDFCHCWDLVLHPHPDFDILVPMFSVVEFCKSEKLFNKSLWKSKNMMTCCGSNLLYLYNISM
ncbi:uncharacterized protein LOC125209116 isoform X2 [Salvia hispanica]|uniref:uncharacterized protein LOC125209116 isoform X2 n=1 Tax=Salvia hispanica TaxID=49212 RepID=UPI0020090360|nr:uncharacterized protein LOC125209116 isoform X2 [Salvia hispanica]